MSTTTPEAAKTRKIPYTIRVIIEQLGVGFNGALTLVGSTNRVYICPDRDDVCRPRFRSKVNSFGLIDFDIGLQFDVNGEPNEKWCMVVAPEANDAYTVYLSRVATHDELARGIRAVVLDKADDVFCENLAHVVTAMYDAAIVKYSGGFVPV